MPYTYQNEKDTGDNNCQDKANHTYNVNTMINNFSLQVINMSITTCKLPEG